MDTATAYARSLNLPRGILDARDLAPGDVILIRRPGAVDRTPELVSAVRRDGGDIVLTLPYGSHRTSPRMPVRLA